jgi:hypothetical protein
MPSEKSTCQVFTKYSPYIVLSKTEALSSPFRTHSYLPIYLLTGYGTFSLLVFFSVGFLKENDPHVYVKDNKTTKL